MSISRSGRPETHLFRIQVTGEFVQTPDRINGIARELGLQGRGAIEGRIICMMVNARAHDIEQLIDKLISALEGTNSASLISRERLPFVQLSGFRMMRTSAALPIRDRHATHGGNMCPDCRTELKDPGDRRFGYPFTECQVCAPDFKDQHDPASPESLKDLTCNACREEAMDPTNRRYLFSEISCPECGPALFWQRREEPKWQLNVRESIPQVIALIREGGIIAVKGNGGYHLIGDASNEKTIRDLRRRKGNVLNPLAVLYPGLSDATTEVDINEQQAAALLSSTGSIVICPFLNPIEKPRIARSSLTGILDRLGVMLPHNPLLQIISSVFEGPLAVTSANRSGQPTIHQSEARPELWHLADAILDHERLITQPREEPVIQFTDQGERILLRSDQPGYPGISVDWHEADMGTALAFSTTSSRSIGYVQDGIIIGLEASLDDMLNKNSNTSTTTERTDKTKINPEQIIMERAIKARHTSFTAAISLWPDVPVMNTWHHEAHFAAVLAEHGLLRSDEAVLGVVWDRGGLGPDGQEWGSEIMIRKEGRMQSFASFDFLSSPNNYPDKSDHRMAALGLLWHRLDARRLIGHLFTREEWTKYERWDNRGGQAKTNSMSHFINGVAAILGLTTEGCNTGSVNGLPLIETVARRIQMDVSLPYELHIIDGKVDWRSMIDTMIGDIDSGAGRDMIARRFLASLANLIVQASAEAGIRKVALSGDVFTSPLLVSMIAEQLGHKVALYIHQYLAPTDDCILIGQLALWADAKHRGRCTQTDTGTSVQNRSEKKE